jgi:XTP/dITP diphosphohydrolase
MSPSPRTPELVLATTNPHKIAELRDLLAGAPYELVDPRDLGVALEVEEDGAAYAANAVIKARAWARATGRLALADDSGLEIDALGGAPGILSARWAGHDTPYPERFRILLARLEGLPPEQRGARYRAAIAVADPARLLFTTEGRLEGRIATAPRGSGGFGYDPIFELPERGMTLGELSLAEKQGISHRARAARAALPLLRQLAAGEALTSEPESPDAESTQGP